MSNKLLRVSNLNKKFYSKNGIVNAIDNVSFDVHEGEVVGLIGESGSGKTTIGRTIMNLHQADSGSIKLRNEEIGGKRLSKKQKKDLYWNVQMIFQDPYSSLNGQKNIKTILSESLTAKKIDDKLLRDIFKNRDEIISFYGGKLRKLFWTGYWDYRESANKTAIEFYDIINNGIDNFVIDKNVTRKQNIDVLNSLYFGQKEIANNHIITKLESFIQSMFDAWKSTQQDYLDGKLEEKDEDELVKFNKQIEQIEIDIKHPKEVQKLLAKKEKLMEELAFDENEFEDLIKKTKESFKYVKKALRKQIADLSNQKFISTNEKDFRYMKFQQDREKFILDVVKYASKKNVIAVDLMERVIELRERISLAFKKQIENIDVETQVFALGAKSIWNETLFEEHSKAFTVIFENEYLEQLHKISNDKVEIAVIDEKIKSIPHYSDTQIQELHAKKEALIKKRADFKVDFDIETKKFFEKLNAEIELLRQHGETVVNELVPKIIETRKSTEQKYLSILNKIMEEIPFDNVAFKNNRASKRSIWNQYKINYNVNIQLEQEIKRNLKQVKIIKTLFNITERKINPIDKILIKRELVKQTVFETLELVGLNKSHAYRYPHEFSGGMRQRVGIARAIISNPQLVIADEPIAALDLSIQAQIVNLLLELKRKKGLAMIFIAHDLSMVEFNSDRVMIMHFGKIVEYGSTKEVFAKPTHPYTKNLIESMPSFDKINEGFKDSKFNPDYLKDYTIFTQPTYRKVSDNHFVLATEGQFETWIKKPKQKSTTKK